MDHAPPSILVVDDDEAARSIMRYRLERQGYRVDEAESGTAALKKIHGACYDAVMMDYRMPGLTGTETVRKLRETHSPDVLPVIMVTAEPESRGVVEALASGVNDHVLKPVDFPVLFARLDTQLKLKSARAEVERYKGDLETLLARRTSELKARERLLEAVIDPLPLPMYVKDAKQRFIMTNPALENFHGLEGSDLLGRTSMEALGSMLSNAEVVHDMDRQVFETGRGLDLPDAALTDSRGRTRIMHLRKIPLRDEDDTIVGTFGFSEDITERELAQEAVVESEARLSGIVDMAMDAIISVDARYTILMFNQGAESIFGYAAGEIIGQSLDVLVPEYARARHREHVRAFGEGEAKARHMSSRALIHGIRKDGTGFPAEASISRLSIRGESIFTVILRDITERVESERALRASEEKFRTLVEGSIQGYYVHRDFEYLFINQSFAEILGYESPEHLQRESPDVRDRLHPEDSAELQRRYHRRIGGEPAPSRYEARWLRRDGSIVWTEMAVGLVNWDGQPAAQGICIDITERKQAEENLLRSRHLLQTVFDTVPHWLFVKDTQARYLMVNTQYASYFGLKPDDFIGKTYREIDRHSDAPAVADTELKDQKVLESGNPSEATYEIVKPDGGRTTRRVIKLPFTLGNGEITGLVGISEDVTERNEAEMALRQAQKMEAVGELTSGVAHDFNNILQIVSGYAQIAAADRELSEKTAGYLKKVLEASDRASNLTRQLLTFSRKSVIQPQALDINQVIANVEKMIRLLLGVNVEMTVHPARELGVVMADPGMVEQILFNLCINARDAMPKGGRIDIHTANFHADEDFRRLHAWSSTGPYVEIGITDTGTGMRPEVRERIFEPFFTTKETGKGTGLGLAMVYGIMQQHGGEIFVYSEPGKGTTFKLYFPIEAGKPVDMQPTESAAPCGGTERILVAEDSQEVQSLLSELLEECGYTVLKASDGIEAVNLFQEQADAVDLVMLDLVLPKLGGREVYQRLRQLRPHLPVVFTSGFGSSNPDTEFIRSESAPLIQKPFRPGDLLEAVRTALDHTPPG